MDSEWMQRGIQVDGGRTYSEVAKELGVSPVVVRCMCNRGITDVTDMKRYLRGTMDDLWDPMLMKGVADAVRLLSGWSGSDIAIASDYDCDGICSAVILKKGLEFAGHTARIYTPDRVGEGYGLNRRIVDDAIRDDCGMIITCDNGIAATDAVSYAVEKGLRVIVTDHHEPQELLPDADIIIDPKQEGDEYPFDGLCGAGVAYKLIQALYEHGDPPDKELSGKQLSDKLNELLPYAGVATVADVMELKDENRILVREGLKCLDETADIGLRALINSLGFKDKKIKAGNVSFQIGPTINATGRIDSVEKAFALLLAQDAGEAVSIADELTELNSKRKAMTERGTKTAVDMVYERFPNADEGELDDVLVLYVEGVHESIVGLIAGKVKERFNHPAIVFTDAVSGDDGEERIKGSGRSIESYHMFNALMKCKDLTIAFGGHAMAAGLTIPKSSLDELRRRLNEDSGLAREDFVRKLIIDVPFPISRLTPGIIKELSVMEPFGVANSSPVFAQKDLRVLRIDYMGAGNQHIKLHVADEVGVSVAAILFFGSEQFDSYIIRKYGERELAGMRRGESEVRLALAYHPDINVYNGRESVQLRMVDWR